MSSTTYDVVIVGAGIAGSIIARELANQQLKVLILESGPQTPPTERQGYLERFFTNTIKTPESPYPPGQGNPADEATPRATTADTFADNVVPDYKNNLDHPDGYIYDPDVSYLLQKGPLPFASTYERVAGGTTWHWLGTSLRFLKNDFQMQKVYGVERNWPIGVDDLLGYYDQAESEIGVAADAQTQEEDLGSIGLEYAPPDYQYPMQAIPLSVVDQTVANGVDGADFIDFEQESVVVTGTPQGRNSQATGSDSRRTCAGNTNCIPICPIQAKYDATVTLSEAQQTGNVTVISQAVANQVNVDSETGQISGIDYITWTDSGSGPERTGTGTAVGRAYVIAAHAIETPRLLQMSATDGLPNGVANSSGLVGKNLMDHPLYLSWGLAKDPVYGYRGPLSTSGIESLRDGSFRNQRAAWRVEIGNEGWNFSIGDPWTSVADFVDGTNASQLNPKGQKLFGSQLVQQLNEAFIRQWRMGFLVEQTPEPSSCVKLSKTLTDGLGLPRPEVRYDLSEYTKLGFVFAEIFSRQVYERLQATNYTQNPSTPTTSAGETVDNPAYFPMQTEWRRFFVDLPEKYKQPNLTCSPVDDQGVPEGFQYFGAGHIVGTYTMGSSATDSVVDADQRSWDHQNLFLVGSGVFPTITTANPTLTIAALAFKAADALKKQLAGG